MSMQTCTDEKGGPHLNIDTTTYFPEMYSNDVAVTDILERYYNVCRCINVPQYVQNMGSCSINNHHDDLFVYSEPYCKEEHSKNMYIRAGHGPESRKMQEYGRVYEDKTWTYQSFGPTPNSTYFKQSCFITPIHAIIHQFEIIEMEHFELSNTTRLTNGSLEEFRKTKKSSRPRVQFFEEPNLEGKYQIGI